MRTKCSRSQSFQRTIYYVVGKDKAKFLSTNIPTINNDLVDIKNELITAMNDQASKGKTSKPCYHVSISPSDEDLKTGISNSVWLDISESFTIKIGLEYHQRVGVLHFDTGRPHLHLVYNLVDLDYKTHELSYNYYKNQAALKEIESEFCLFPTWNNNHWLRISEVFEESETSRQQSEKKRKIADIASTYNAFLDNLGQDYYTGSRYILERNDDDLYMYQKEPKTLLMSASFFDGHWWCKNSTVSDPELEFFLQLEVQMRDYLQLNFSEKEDLSEQIQL